jgi:hypothetical protein
MGKPTVHGNQQHQTKRNRLLLLSYASAFYALPPPPNPMIPIQSPARPTIRSRATPNPVIPLSLSNWLARPCCRAERNICICLRFSRADGLAFLPFSYQPAADYPIRSAFMFPRLLLHLLFRGEVNKDNPARNGGTDN